MKAFLVLGLLAGLSAIGATGSEVAVCKRRCEQKARVCETRCERFPGTTAKVRCRGKCSNEKKACEFVCSHRG